MCNMVKIFQLERKGMYLIYSAQYMYARSFVHKQYCVLVKLIWWTLYVCTSKSKHVFEHFLECSRRFLISKNFFLLCDDIDVIPIQYTIHTCMRRYPTFHMYTLYYNICDRLKEGCTTHACLSRCVIHIN